MLGRHRLAGGPQPLERRRQLFKSDEHRVRQAKHLRRQLESLNPCRRAKACRASRLADRRASAGRVSRLIAGVLLAFAVGWFASTRWSGLGGLVVEREITGTVAVVNASGAKVCIAPLDGSAQVCGLAYQRPDVAPMAVGDRVTVAVVALREGELES